MAGTRSSARQAAKNSSSPASAQEQADHTTGSKRKASSTASPTPKREKKSNEKSQVTIEESFGTNGAPKETEDVDMQESAEVKNPSAEAEISKDSAATKDANEASNGAENKESEKQQAKDDEKADEVHNGPDQAANNGDTSEPKETDPKGSGSNVKDDDNAVEVTSEREKAIPSSILEKGIIYFFFRGRVGIDEPDSVADVARSYIVLRPLPKGAKLGEGPIGDEKNNRLLALPKKVLPKSPKDKFMTFVEKANMSMDEIKDVFASSDYATKTSGDRHSPAAAPVGEGVYAFTQTGRDTHLAYILTLPSEISDVQKDIGLRERGSYVTSAKNPEASGPASAALPQKAEFPQDILDQFGGRGWMPLQPKMLDYENAQFLIIGHGEDALEKATEPQNGEQKDPEKETPLEEVEKLEHEDEIRVKHLDGKTHLAVAQR